MDLIVIEDDTNFAMLVAHALEGLTDSVSVYSDWKDAFERVKKGRQGDVAWVDLRMPSSSEKETISHIAKMRRDHNDIVIIVGSGYITPEIRAALEKIGADGVYYKGGKYTPEQIGSLIVLGLMRASKRKPHSMDSLLNKAMDWFHQKFPNIPLA